MPLARHPAAAAAVALSAAGAVLGALSLPLLRDPARDTFFHLDPPARAGLVALSFAMIALVLWLLALKTVALRRAWPARSTPARLALAGFDVGLGWLIYLTAHQLSPQLYYLYYLLVIPDLPLLLVLPEGIDWDRIRDVVAIAPKQRLSDLLASIGFWAVPTYTLLLHRDPLPA